VRFEILEIYNSGPTDKVKQRMRPWAIFLLLLSLFNISTLMLQAFRSEILMRCSSQRLFMSTNTNKKIVNQAKFFAFANELKNIITTTGLSGVGIIRSVQVVRGLAKVASDYAKNSQAFEGVNGQLSFPKVFKRLFEELGATYIKLGQFVASSPTIFPAEYVEEFQTCLDRTPTVPYSTVRRIIQEDLKLPLASIYASIDPIPLASASIAQVHRAKLKDGTEVVIKVRKPGVDATLKADLAFLLIASKFIELISPSLSTLSLACIVEDIRDSMLDELDFRKEAQNLLNFRSFLYKNQILDAIAPQPYLKASGQRVLTMDFLQGVPLVDLENIRRYSSSPEATLISALRTWAFTVATNDIFHADVHAGNLLVLEDGRIGFIDFGIGKRYPGHDSEDNLYFLI
jgi:aarF domain-containing kinase